jgi:hypothetical protein
MPGLVGSGAPCIIQNLILFQVDFMKIIIGGPNRQKSATGTRIKYMLNNSKFQIILPAIAFHILV